MSTHKVAGKKRVKTKKKLHGGGEPTLTSLVESLPDLIKQKEAADPLLTYETIQKQLQDVMNLNKRVNEATSMDPPTRSKLLQKLDDTKKSLEAASILALSTLKTTTMAGGAVAGKKRKTRARSISIKRGGDPEEFTISPMVGGAILPSWLQEVLGYRRESSVVAKDAIAAEAAIAVQAALGTQRGATGTAGQGVAGQGLSGPPGPQGLSGAPGPQGPPGIVWRGVFDPTRIYRQNDVVYYDGSAWICNNNFFNFSSFLCALS